MPRQKKYKAFKKNVNNIVGFPLIGEFLRSELKQQQSLPGGEIISDDMINVMVWRKSEELRKIYEPRRTREIQERISE